MSTDDTAFESHEVQWGIDDTTVDGTLALPAGAGPFPAVVFIAGSGPTDRNWNTPLLPGTNGSGRLIAEALARAGFATLRYDKRVAGPRAQENLSRLAGKISLQGHLDELTSAVQTLAARPDVDRRRIFALTNSEGALHALNYQLHAPAIPYAGLVLTAPPGRAVGAVAHMQIAAQLAAVPGGDGILRRYDEAVARFLAGEEMNADPSLPEGIQMLLQGLAAPINQPFSRELWAMDPTNWLARITVPVLIVIGKKDLQVDWQQDGQPLERAAAGHGNFTFVYPPDANHVLKHEARPRAELSGATVAESYNCPDTVLDDVALDAIRDWLQAHA